MPVIEYHNLLLLLSILYPEVQFYVDDILFVVDENKTTQTKWAISQKTWTHQSLRTKVLVTTQIGPTKLEN